jgi:hypothetical protein
MSLVQVDELNNEFDARRSTGYLCAATARTFEQVISAKCWKFKLVLLIKFYLMNQT